MVSTRRAYLSEYGFKIKKRIEHIEFIKGSKTKPLTSFRVSKFKTRPTPDMILKGVKKPFVVPVKGEKAKTEGMPLLKFTERGKILSPERQRLLTLDGQIEAINKLSEELELAYIKPTKESQEHNKAILENEKEIRKTEEKIALRSLSMRNASSEAKRLSQQKINLLKDEKQALEDYREIIKKDLDRAMSSDVAVKGQYDAILATGSKLLQIKKIPSSYKKQYIESLGLITESAFTLLSKTDFIKYTDFLEKKIDNPILFNNVINNAVKNIELHQPFSEVPEQKISEKRKNFLKTLRESHFIAEKF